MKLADLRRLSIRKQLKIRFRLVNGMECVITEHGVAQVPALRRVPDFNLEQELSSVTEFVLEPVSDPKPVANPTPRAALEAMVSTGPSPSSDHEEE